MSLTDLKKIKDHKESPSKKKNFTVDDFINDAENYAKGTPEIVSSDKNQPLTIAQAISLAKQRSEQKQSSTSKPYRHATFTLSEEAIEQLQSLAQQSNLAKSHIIRILINEICNKDQQQQLQKLLNSEAN